MLGHQLADAHAERPDCRTHRQHNHDVLVQVNAAIVAQAHKVISNRIGVQQLPCLEPDLSAHHLQLRSGLCELVAGTSAALECLRLQ